MVLLDESRTGASPAERILARYTRTMAYLADAVKVADAAYLYDARDVADGGPRLVAVRTVNEVFHEVFLVVTDSKSDGPEAPEPEG